MIKCMIVDDEPIAIRVLEAHLDHIPDIEVAATSTNAVDALQEVKDHAIDLVFLDIEMPALSGIGFVESLADPPRFIFTTAHRDYAVRGFDLDAVDYLMKPIGFPRLLRAVEKYRRLRDAEPDMSDSSGAQPDARPDAINIRVDRRTIRIDLDDILYVESLSDYVVIHTDANQYTSKLRIGDLDEQLAPHGIIRIHRSYLAAIRRVDSFTSREVQIGETALPVSRSYRVEVMQRLRGEIA